MGEECCGGWPLPTAFPSQCRWVIVCVKPMEKQSLRRRPTLLIQGLQYLCDTWGKVTGSLELAHALPWAWPWDGHPEAPAHIPRERRLHAARSWLGGSPAAAAAGCPAASVPAAAPPDAAAPAAAAPAQPAAPRTYLHPARPGHASSAAAATRYVTALPSTPRAPTFKVRLLTPRVYY